MATFTDLDKHDLHELFRIYDFAKVNKVDDVVERSMQMSQSPEMLFDELYKQYEIAKLPKREELMQQMHDAVPNASSAEILSVIRVTEMKKFSASDALRALRRQMSQVNRATPNMINEEEKSEKVKDVMDLTSTSSHSLPSSSYEREHIERETNQKCHEFKTLNQEECRETQNGVNNKCVSSDDQKASSMDELVSRDVQDWVARVIGDNYSKYYIPQSECSSTAFMDSLRDGVVLHILLQKLHYPSMSDDEVVIPKRTRGFFARDNVSVFLQQVQERYELHEAELFTNSDLCDGKNDRQVITCLLSLARAAYAHGDTTYLPSLISFEKEIESKKCTITTEELNKIIADAEAETEWSAPQQMEENKSSVGDEHRNEQQQEEELQDDKITFEDKEYNEKDNNITPLNEIHKQESIKENAELTEKEAEVTEEEVIEESKRTEQCLETLKIENSKQEEVEQEEKVCKDNTATSTAPEQEKECSEDFVYSKEKIGDVEEETSEKNSNNSSAANQEEKEKQEEVSLDERKTESEQAAHGTSRVFYVRDNHITREKTLEDNVVSNVNTNNINHHNKLQASSSVLMRHPYSVEKPCPPHLLSIKESTKDVLVPRYHARHWDGIDCLLGTVLNAHYARFPHSPWRFRALFSQPGEYVVYNRRSADKHVIHIRAIHDRLLIHQPQPVANKTRFVYHWVELAEALEQMENV